MKKDILGIKIDDINKEKIIEVIISWLETNKKHYIVTPNPEIVMMAQKDKELKDIINQADLSIADGAGLKIATDIDCITPGVELMEELINRSQNYGFTIGFLGGTDRVAEKCADCLLQKYPKLKISFVSDGGTINNKGESEGIYGIEYIVYSPGRKVKKALGNIHNIPQTDILFVAFGPPKQEKWVFKNINKLPVKVVVVVGGSFDYLSQTVLRAPKFIRDLGFEWLFRLVLQPWRIKRQLALIKFILMVL